MYHYLFTNDLRISHLEESLIKAGACFVNNTVPSATQDKNANNNMKTLGFYFNLTNSSSCALACMNGNTRKVILNFIKKFQYPNLRTNSSYNDSLNDGILLAPMRVILQFLYIMSMQDKENAYLEISEILDFIFFNSRVAKSKKIDFYQLMSDLIEYRRSNKYPESIELDENKRFWKQAERQVREMSKILTWAGCVEETNRVIRLKDKGLTKENKSDIYDILSYNDFWQYDGNGDLIESYQTYMDLSHEEVTEDENQYSNIETDESEYNIVGDNILLYGVPGSGKSWTIAHEYCSNEENIERLVFHPDYTYADFVGQILPDVDDGNVKYEFTPGPFTSIMEKAYINPNKHYYLIIEEINRGNAAGIFGEVFQLLDRMSEDRVIDGVIYKAGTSEYGITNKYIADYVYGISNRKVRIPSNLSIIATMNTSDQNVFTLDTAFQRRWHMRMIKNSFDSVNADLANANILDSDITWKQFCLTINHFIAEENGQVVSSADKCMGTYFVSKSELYFDTRIHLNNITENERINALHQNYRFAEKVIKYLWDDAVKFSRESIFNLDVANRLEDVIEIFSSNSGNSRFIVFNELVNTQLGINHTEA